MEPYEFKLSGDVLESDRNCDHLPYISRPVSFLVRGLLLLKIRLTHLKPDHITWAGGVTLERIWVAKRKD